jgi:hypothetical protein
VTVTDRHRFSPTVDPAARSGFARTVRRFLLMTPP